MDVNTNFTIATEQIQLMTEGGFLPPRRDQSESSIFQQDIKTNSPLHVLKTYSFTQKSPDKLPNGTISVLTNENHRSSINEENMLNSAQEEQLKAFEHRMFNPGNEFAQIDNIISEQNHQATNSVLQIKIDHPADIFEFFEREQSYHTIEIIDYECFLTVTELASIDHQLRNLSKKFKGLRITNVELTVQHLKILEFGIFSKRKDLEIQFNNNNVDDQCFFQFLLESRCYKIFQFINNIGMLKFIEQIYSKHQTYAGRPRNVLKISEYNVVLERSDDDLVLTLHTGQNQFAYLTNNDDFKLKYPVVNYDLNACQNKIIQDVLQSRFARINLPQIYYLSIKIEIWNLEAAADAIYSTKTINTLDISGSTILADANFSRVFFKDRQFRLKELFLRNIPFSNPAFKIFVQHFIYSDFTTIKALDLSECGLNDEKIFLLCENIRLRQDKITLEQLYLQRNPLIGEEGWRRLFTLMIFGKCTNITDLDLRGCLLTQKHIKEGIIAGMRQSHRFIRKFSIRFPLRRFFISTSELTTESWKTLLNEFIFYTKMGLTHFNSFFTGFFMSNNVLSNESLYMRMGFPEIKTENYNSPTAFSSPRFDSIQENNKSIHTNNPIIQNSYATTRNSQDIQVKENSLNAISYSIKNIQTTNANYQNKGASQSSASSETGTQPIIRQKKSTSQQQNHNQLQQNNFQLEENQQFNCNFNQSPITQQYQPESPNSILQESAVYKNILKNPIDDSVISNDINNNNNSNINASMNESANNTNNSNCNTNNNNSYVNITSPNLQPQKSPSQTNINQAYNSKSYFSKESVYKQNINKKSGSGSGLINSKVLLNYQDVNSISSLNQKNNSSNKEVNASPQNVKTGSIVTQIQKSSYQIPQSISHGAKSLESFNSFKSKTITRGLVTVEDQQLKFETTEGDLTNNYPYIKTFDQVDQKNQSDQENADPDHSQMLLIEAKQNKKQSKDWNMQENAQTQNLQNLSVNNTSQLEMIVRNESSSLSAQQQSIQETIKTKKKNSVNLVVSFPFDPPKLQKSESLKNIKDKKEQESETSNSKRKEWQKLKSYSHQKESQQFQKEPTQNKNFKRSITHTGPSSSRNYDENGKYSKSPGSSANNSMEKTSVLKTFHKKSSFGYKHVKSNQEIMDNINQVVFTESIKSVARQQIQADQKNGQKDYSTPYQIYSSPAQNEAFNSLNQIIEKGYMSKKASDNIEVEKLSSERYQIQSTELNVNQYNITEEFAESSDNNINSRQSKVRISLPDKGKKVIQQVEQNSPYTKQSQPVTEKTITEPVVFHQAVSVVNNNSYQTELNNSKIQQFVKYDNSEQKSPGMNMDSQINVPPIQFPPSLSEIDDQKDQQLQSMKKAETETLKQIDDKPQEQQTVVKTKQAQRLSQKQNQVMEKVKKKNCFFKQHRKQNFTGIIRKQDVVGTSEHAIFNFFEGFLKSKRNFLQQIIFHNIETFPYLANDTKRVLSQDFTGNIQYQYIQNKNHVCGIYSIKEDLLIKQLATKRNTSHKQIFLQIQFKKNCNFSPAGWQRLFFLIQKCEYFIVPVKNQNSVIPVLPLFNEKFEYFQPIQDFIIKQSTSTELYKNLKFFYINADSQLYKIYRGNLTPLQWLYFNPQSNIQIIKSNCYSTFINLEKNVYMENNNTYTYKVEVIDFNWEGSEKGWRIFVQNVMMNKRFKLKKLYLRNVAIDVIVNLVDEYKLKYQFSQLPSQKWDLDVFSFSYATCSSPKTFVKFLFYFSENTLLKLAYNGMEDMYYVFGPNYKEEILEFRRSNINSRLLDNPYCLNQMNGSPFRLFAPYIAHFFVNMEGNFFPHFFTKSVVIQLSEAFQQNSIISCYNQHKKFFSSNLNARIQGYLQSRSPSPPHLKLKQFICESNKGNQNRTQYSKLIEPCFMLSHSRDDFTDQIISFNCSLFEGGSLVIDPPKLRKIIVSVNLINIYLFDQKSQESHLNSSKSQSKDRSMSLKYKFNQDLHIYLSIEEKLNRYKDVVGFNDARQEIQLYLNYAQYLQYKEYMKKMMLFGYTPEYHHPYNYYNCLEIECKSIVLILQSTCNKSCGQRCGRTADILYYYNEMYNISQREPDFLTFIKLNKKVTPYYFSPFLWKRLMEMYNEEHILNFLYCTNYIEDINYNSFDYLKIHHFFIILVIQIILCAFIMIYNEVNIQEIQEEIFFALLGACFTCFLFGYEIYLLFQLFQKSRPLISLKKLNAKRKTFERYSSMKPNPQESFSSKSKRLSSSSQNHNFSVTGSTSALGINQSKHSKDQIEYYPIQEHWLLYPSPKQIKNENKLSIAFALVRSFVSTMVFFIQILIQNISKYMMILTFVIYLISIIIIKKKNSNKIYRDNVWIKAFIMNIVEFDVLELFASRISYSYVFTIPNIPLVFGKYSGRTVSGKIVMSLIKLLIRDIPLFILWNNYSNYQIVLNQLIFVALASHILIHIVTILFEKTHRLSPENAQAIIEQSRKILSKVKQKYLVEYDKQIETFLSLFR